MSMKYVERELSKVIDPKKIKVKVLDYSKVKAEKKGDRRSEEDRVQLTSLLKLVFDAIIESVKNAERVIITKFGTFSVETRKARSGTNPITRQKEVFPEKKVIRFRPSKTLKKIIAE